MKGGRARQLCLGAYVVVAVVPLVAGCGNQPDLTCQTQISDYGMRTATVAVWIGRLVAEQAAQDQTHAEDWVDTSGAVTYPDGNDLQTVALAFGMLPLSFSQPAPTLPYQVDIATQLGGDANNLADDVGTFLGDASIGDLTYGWQNEYAQVKTDIGAVASDCGVPHAGM